MKKNAILFVIDSLSYERITGNGASHLTPCFHRLMQEHISCSRMYSQAPYTEAALMGLICGAPTMNHGGYMMRYRDVPATLPEVFARSGYDVYSILQPHIYPSSLYRGLPVSFYNVGFDFNALWSYRLQYYSSLYDQNVLDDQDYAELTDMLEDNFREWCLFLQRLLKRDDSVSLIQDNLEEYDVPAILAQVQHEQAAFLQNPRVYVETLLREKQAHSLFRIPTLNQNHKIHSSACREEIRRAALPLASQLAERQRACDVRWNQEAIRVLAYTINRFLHQPNKESLKDILRFCRYISQRRNPQLVLDRAGENFDAYKAAPSVHRHFAHFFRWVDSRPERRDPYFAYIHVDDIHNPEVFFSYDAEDPALVFEELADAKRYLDNLSPDYRGSLTYDLALQYMDRKLAGFLRELEERHMLQDTAVYITADHGFSFYNHPLRYTVPNNFYQESYHVPFIVINGERNAQTVDGWHSTMDIPATILSEAGIALPDHFQGNSIFKAQRDFVTMEYMGGGCPDIRRRPVRYAVRTDKFSAVYSAPLASSFEQGYLDQLFDLRADPSEQHNLAYRRQLTASPEIQDLLAPLKKRHAELREMYRVD